MEDLKRNLNDLPSRYLPDFECCVYQPHLSNSNETTRAVLATTGTERKHDSNNIDEGLNTMLEIVNNPDSNKIEEEETTKMEIVNKSDSNKTVEEDNTTLEILNILNMSDSNKNDEEETTKLEIVNNPDPNKIEEEDNTTLEILNMSDSNKNDEVAPTAMEIEDESDLNKNDEDETEPEINNKSLPTKPVKDVVNCKAKVNSQQVDRDICEGIKMTECKPTSRKRISSFSDDDSIFDSIVIKKTPPKNLKSFTPRKNKEIVLPQISSNKDTLFEKMQAWLPEDDETTPNTSTPVAKHKFSSLKKNFKPPFSKSGLLPDHIIPKECRLKSGETIDSARITTLYRKMISLDGSQELSYKVINGN